MFVFFLLIIFLQESFAFQHRFLRSAPDVNHNLQVTGAEYVYACMNDRCNKIKNFEVLEKEPLSCYDQGLLINFDYVNPLNDTSRVRGYLNQEKGAPVMLKQQSSTECKRIKR